MSIHASGGDHWRERLLHRSGLWVRVPAASGSAASVPVPGRQHAVEVGQPPLMTPVPQCSADRAVPEGEQHAIMDDNAVGPSTGPWWQSSS